MRVFCIFPLILFLIGCDALPNLKGKQGTGMILGAGVGSYIGQVAGGDVLTAGGGLMGAYVGFNMLKMFNDKRKYAEEAFFNALETSPKFSTTSWYNPYDNTSGSYTPIATYQRPDGAYCREVSETVRYNSRLHTNRVTACREDDGKWKLM